MERRGGEGSPARRSHLRRALAAAGLALLAVGLRGAEPAGAAPSLRVRVDARGALRFTRAQLRALGIRAVSQGLVPVDFLPAPARPAPAASPQDGKRSAARRPSTPSRGAAARRPASPVPPAAPARSAGEPAVTLWVPLRADGSLFIARTRLGPGQVLPGPPGALYEALGGQPRLRLRRLSKP